MLCLAALHTVPRLQDTSAATAGKGNGALPGVSPYCCFTPAWTADCQNVSGHITLQLVECSVQHAGCMQVSLHLNIDALLGVPHSDRISGWGGGGGGGEGEGPA